MSLVEHPIAHAPQEGVKCHQNTDQQIGKFKNWNSCVHKIYLRFIVHYFCSPTFCCIIKSTSQV